MRELERGEQHPYHGEKPKDWAERVVCGILWDMSDRGGIKHELGAVDADVRKDMVEALAKIVRAGAPSDVPRPSCDWTQDQDGVYHTGCKNAFFFDTGSAGENNAKFCQYCGGGLKVIDYTDPDIGPQEPLNIGRDVSDNSPRQEGGK